VTAPVWALPAPFTHIPFTDVTSTMDEAWRLVQIGSAGHGAVITAQQQTKGRGRQGNVWHSGPQNLYMTCAWQLAKGERAGDYSLVAAVALEETIRSFLPTGPLSQIKWPNDILVDGKKIAGILLESPDPKWLLIGMGVNIGLCPPERVALSHVCAHNNLSLETVLVRLLENLETRIDDYQAHGLTPILDRWRAHAYGLHQPIRVRLPQTEFGGIFRGLDAQGACLVEMPGGQLRQVYAGEVFFPNDATGP
jgi:BirA family biotin operon repressor/biotin-[acetyl-CoA-carboxylase] ligase